VCAAFEKLASAGSRWGREHRAVRSVCMDCRLSRTA